MRHLNCLIQNQGIVISSNRFFETLVGYRILLYKLLVFGFLWDSYNLNTSGLVLSLIHPLWVKYSYNIYLLCLFLEF